MFALNTSPALTFGFPDVCITMIGPVPTPVPYPNFANASTGFPVPAHILMSVAPVQNQATMLFPTLGDLPGFLGVASGTVLGPCQSLTHANTFLTGGLPTKRLSSMGFSNGINAPSTAIIPNQTKVLVLKA
jgi:hypothetical protein